MTLVLTLAAPMLLSGMIVGLCVSIFQSITSISEQSLSMIPKMLAVLTAIFLLMPWILNMLKTFTGPLFGNLHGFIS